METTTSIDLELLARETGVPLDKVTRTLELLDEGNTIPFITRFRKDQTGGLDEERLRELQQKVAQARQLAERKQTITRTIEAQGKLTPALSEKITKAATLKQLEDLYLPFKPKKQTLATTARERGLEQLAIEVFKGDGAAWNLHARAATFVNPEKGVPSVDEALVGVGHIVAEYISENPELRSALRKIMLQTGKLVCSRMPPPEKPQPQSAPAPSDGSVSVLEAAQAEDAARVTPAEIANAEMVAEGGPPHADPPAAKSPHPHGEPAIAPAAEPLVSPPPEVAESPTPAEQAPPTTSPPDEPSGESNPSEPPAVGPEAAGESASGSEPAAEAPLVDQEAFAQAAAEAKARFAPKPVELKKVASNLTRRKKDAKKAKRKQAEIAFRDYFDFKEQLAKLPPHRVLAINRGERENVLRVKIDCDLEAVYKEAEKIVIDEKHPHAEFLRECLRDALARLILPSLEREVRRELTEKAETHAATVFARNLRHLLLQPPIRGRRVLAIDPGYRSGCKVVAIDEFGNALGHGMIHLVGGEERRKHSRHRLVEMARLYHVSVIAIGNGAACREAEQLVSDLLAHELREQEIGYVIVNEAGASVYSTSTLGREELPHFDPVLRSAISIGRRTLDPLSELVKINPSNIGVGLYQHDVKAKHLRDSLDGVVESCVNFVGVDVNTASPSLLRYVSGLNQLTARRIYEYRTQHGPFSNREEIRKVPGVGDASFVQAAGFLKINSGDNPLDATWIHPESYSLALKLLEKLGSSLDELAPKAAPSAAAPQAASLPTDHSPGEAPAHAEVQERADEAHEGATEEAHEGEAAAHPVEEQAAPEPAAEAPAADSVSAEATPAEPAAAAEAPAAADPAAAAAPSPVAASLAPLPLAAPPEPAPLAALREKLTESAKTLDIASLAKEWGVGELTLRDVLAGLTRPGRDPREDLPPPIFRRGILKLDDLAPNMELSGTVLNVVDFGAFVDVGLGDSGLVHISRLADRYISDPHEVVSVGDVLRVWVVSVDKERRRVSLTAIAPGTQKPQQRRERGERPQRGERPAGAGRPSGQGGQGGGRPPRGGGRPQGQGAPAGAGTGSGPPQGQGGGRGGRPPQGRGGGGGGGGRGGHGGGGRGGRPEGPSKPYVTKQKPAPLKPITKKMEEGKEPMRTFGDLMQFVQKKEQKKNPPPPAQNPPPAAESPPAAEGQSDLPPTT